MQNKRRDSGRRWMKTQGPVIVELRFLDTLCAILSRYIRRETRQLDP